MAEEADVILVACGRQIRSRFRRSRAIARQDKAFITWYKRPIAPSEHIILRDEKRRT